MTAPPPPGWLRDPQPRPRRLLVGLAVLVFSLAHLAFVAATPLAGGPREPVASYAPAERWTPPPAVRDARFATFPFVAAEGSTGLWVLPSSALPLEFVAEQEVLDRFGEDELVAAIEAWNGTPGTRFEATVTRAVDAGVDERKRDNVNRIFRDRHSCGGRYLARAHMWPGETVVRDGLIARYVSEVDLGVCDRLRPDQLARVVRHELGHVAGLDHLCDEGEDCWDESFAPDNTCRVMSPRAHPCQEIARGDLDGLVHLHPRLPRASGSDARATSASVAFATHPVPRSAMQVVISAYDGEIEHRIAGATLAGHLGVPHLQVDADCTTGPDGQALDRVLAVAGRVVAVGPVPGHCLATLRGAWAAEVEELPTTEAVEDRVLELLKADGEAPTRLFVAPLDAPSRGTPVAAVAASAAVALEAPLAFVRDPSDAAPVLRVVEAHPEIGQVVLVADTAAAGLRVTLDLAAAGVRVQRVSAVDAAAAASALASSPRIDLPRPLHVAIASTEHPEHSIAAISLAAASGGLLLPIEAELSSAHVELLHDQVSQGAIVGGRNAITTQRQMALSRLVDGDTEDLDVLVAPG